MFNFVVHWNEKGIGIETGMSVYALWGDESGGGDNDVEWDIDGGCKLCDNEVIIWGNYPSNDPCDGPEADPCECYGDCGDPCDEPGADPCECSDDCNDPCNAPEADPCTCWGECGDPPPELEKDCAGVQNGEAFLDQCGECVGGTTNKQPCQEDCAGVFGGKAYLNECNECINGNYGKFNNNLTGSALNQFNQVLNDMMSNCLRATLLNNLNNYYGINISMGTNGMGLGSFDPCDYSIKFDSLKNINSYTLTGELFHAFQEQFLNGKLLQIKLDVTNNHVGGSNIEFEEKAMNILSGYFTGGTNSDPGTEKLGFWCNNFLINHPIHSNVVLTQQEIDSWFEALEEFQEHHQNLPGLYGKPIDFGILPTSLLNLWNLSNCEY